MQLFSRNKAIVALSLGALALGACGDDVTVPVAPAAPITLSITPPSANMNIGEAVNFAVQISGGPSTGAPTLASCTTSSATVATAAVSGSSCRVTAIAAGNATITATASTGQSAAASVSVAAPAAAISGLQVSPTAASVQVNQTVTIVPNVNKGASAVTVAYTYASSTASVATVTAAGVVTAVAPGVATITVTATGTGTGFTTTTLTSAAAITVTALPTGMTSLNVTPTTLALSAGGTAQLVVNAQQPTGAAAASIIYGTTAPAVATVGTTGRVTAVGPGTAVITVTATSAANANFAAATLSGTVAVTVTPAAQVIINSLTQYGNTIDISDVEGQFEVNMALQPNGQIVSSVQAFVCANGEATDVCVARSPAAQQTFGAAGGQAGSVQLYINSAEFSVPNFTTGADANTLYKNGLRTIVATVTAAGQSPSASNNLSAVNFNNEDGWTLQWSLPSKRANDLAGNTWYGGPAAAGTGTFTVVPVMYTQGRTISNVTISPATSGACGNDITLYARPFRGSYGVQARDTIAGAFNCAGVQTNLNGHAPSVYASIDNNNAAGPIAPVSSYPSPGVSVFTYPTYSGSYYRYQTSLAYQPTGIYVPADYLAPSITRFDVRGGGATSTDSGWVNGSYAFNRVIDAVTGATSYQINDGSGVGIFPTASRTTLFSVCATPSTIATDAATSCTTPVATGGLTATIASINVPESATNLTNQAYFAVASETDRLGNLRTSNAFTYANVDAGTVNATDARVTFGVDRTAPVIAAIPNESATADALNPALAGVRSGIDSIFRNSGNTYTATSGDGSTSINATSALFAVRTSDERSGFYRCTASVSCTTTDANQFHLGSFQIVRRRAPNSPLATNDATVENMIATSTALVPTWTNVMNGTAPAANTGLRQFSINIFGDAARAPSGVTASSASAGYYTFSGTLVDRAGNTTTVPTRNVAIDIAAPTLNNVILPATYTGGATAGLTIQASDDLELMGAELRLNLSGFGAITFPRVTNFAATTRTGFFQNPFAALTSNKLASPTGFGQFYAGTVNLPIPLIHDLQVVPAGAVGTGAVSSPSTTAAAKPDTIGARVFDIKALANPTGGTTPATLSASSSSWDNRAIAGNQVSANTVSGSLLRKNWGANENVGSITNTGAQIGDWVVYNSGTAVNATVEFRARALTSSASVPFTAVYVVAKRYNTTSFLYEDYEYKGAATYAGSIDDGGTRYFRYTVPAAFIAASAQGNNVSNAAFTGLDSIRAIGVDASGNGLATPAAIPGTTATENAITAVAQGSINVFPASPTAPIYSTSASYSGLTGAWFTRSFSTTPALEAASIATDARIFVGTGAATNRTARIYFSITTSAGLAATASGNTTVACSSNDPAIEAYTPGGIQSSLKSSNTGSSSALAYCDVRGLTVGGVANITAAVTRSGSFAPFTGNTVNAVSSPIYVGDPTITALGSVSALGASVASGTSKVSTFTIAAPTFAGAFNASNATMSYLINNQLAASSLSASSGVSTSVLVNGLTGAATVTVTCTSTAITNTMAFAFHVVGRGVSLLGYANPLATGTTGAAAVSGNCSTM